MTQYDWQTLQPYLVTALPNNHATRWLLESGSEYEMQWDRFLGLLVQGQNGIPLSEAINAFKNNLPASTFRQRLSERRK